MTYADLRDEIKEKNNLENLPEEKVDSSKPCIKSVDELLSWNLDIPDYQRPYKWSVKNITDLIEDISNAIDDRDKYGDKYFYRVGSVILHVDREKNVFHIVDGQQRLTSLYLIKHYLCSNKGESINCSLKNTNYSDPDAKRNLFLNYKFIREWFSVKTKDDTSLADKFLKAFKDVLQVVVLFVNEESEAFQLFDSQNSRGRELDPHDLLKAFHLRAMQNNKYEMERAVTIWEAREPEEIKDLFSRLFNVWNWSKKEKSGDFTTQDIYIYKGVSEESPYTYAKRLNRVMPYYQMTEPFVMGNDFFEMIGHYLDLQSDIAREIEESFGDMYRIIKNPDYEKFKSFIHAKNLFFTVLLCYYDRFHNFDPLAVTKLFAWSFMICCDFPRFDDRTIQKYAIGEKSSVRSYSNVIPMFSLICEARTHIEIAAIHIDTGNTKKSDDKWKALHDNINNILGVTPHV